MGETEPEHPSTAAEPERPPERYQPLMTLTVRHDFYGNAAQGGAHLCPDFTIAPTRPSQDLLRYLGLIARPRRAGIDILYSPQRCLGMMQYLWQARERRVNAKRSRFDLDRAKRGCWSRIGLRFTSHNELFQNFTNMPMTAAPGGQALYLSNRRCAAGTAGTLSPWHGAIDVLPIAVWAGNYEFLTGKDPVDLRVHDTSGRTLLYACRNVRQQFADKTAGELVPPLAELEQSGAVHGKLGAAASGLYSYDTTYRNAPTTRNRFLYFGEEQTPLLYVDLHFASPESPDATENGRFPIVLPDARPDKEDDAACCVTRCDYEISFQARQTTWIYYVVLPANFGSADGLAIENAAATGPQFGAPTAVEAPVAAAKFIATKAWPLRHRSDVALRLRGAGRSGNGTKRVLLERLPVPSPEQISFAKAQPTLTDGAPTSEMFVYV